MQSTQCCLGEKRRAPRLQKIEIATCNSMSLSHRFWYVFCAQNSAQQKWNLCVFSVLVFFFSLSFSVAFSFSHYKFVHRLNCSECVCVFICADSKLNLYYSDWLRRRRRKATTTNTHTHTHKNVKKKNVRFWFDLQNVAQLRCWTAKKSCFLHKIGKNKSSFFHVRLLIEGKLKRTNGQCSLQFDRVKMYVCPLHNNEQLQ